MRVKDSDMDKLLMPLTLDCRNMILEFRIFKLRYIYREANGVVDLVAKETVNFEDYFVTLSNPSSQVVPNIKSEFVGLGKIKLVALN